MKYALWARKKALRGQREVSNYEVLRRLGAVSWAISVVATSRPQSTVVQFCETNWSEQYAGPVERRHQVFISSTFTDLIDERRQVIEALLEMDSIPAGMELFAAGNTDQWSLIQQVIDESDYYIVIVGGRYGSTTAEGVSYTEKEYDYAISQGIPVMGFVHADPAAIPSGKSELDPDARAKLDAFRTKVQKKLIRTYSTPAELGGVVSRGLHKLQKDFPRQGWVRGDLAMTPDTEARIAEMRAELAELRQAAAEAKTNAAEHPKIDGLASGDDEYQFVMNITGTKPSDANKSSYSRTHYIWTVPYVTTWNEILERIGPSLIDEASEREIGQALEAFGIALTRAQPDRRPKQADNVTKRQVLPATVDDVLVQLFALGLISRGSKKRTMSDHNKYWVLTSAGQDQVMRLRAIRRPSPEEALAKRRSELTGMTVTQLRSFARNDFHLSGQGNKSQLVDAILEAEHVGAEK